MFDMHSKITYDEIYKIYKNKKNVAIFFALIGEELKLYCHFFQNGGKAADKKRLKTASLAFLHHLRNSQMEFLFSVHFLYLKVPSYRCWIKNRQINLSGYFYVKKIRH